ncbi:TPM domain-containing protein [Gracilimonas mengyeensis]|uniref:TLP18.3, Psb32 and MOLO-1 founding protein of phosphatase n=1 Tax=Gracilimonas mengyeensis TaxID=1302730 RepID=A0A521BD56_9BACT|nr:TPM domain-containing protein [Gracilimonas mengyeensis]SMO44989.1 TLP18.3, Psb32 and MOLO-1 founding protein of phosphatase [Gracilimonas mengyeensis]
MAKFLTQEQEERIVEAISQAEEATSGEIRIHIEKNCKAESPIERAKEVFAELNMHETEFRNGVIVYIAWKDKKVAIWGDEGIHTKVGQQFWEEELKLILKYFKAGDYETGLSEVALQIGQKLKENFPYEQKGATNELSDDISYNPEDKESDA